MKFYLHIRIILIFFCLFGISSCGSALENEGSSNSINELEQSYPAYPAPNTENTTSSNRTSTRVVEIIPPQENLSTLTGLVYSERTNKPLIEIPVQLAEVIYSGDQGAFVLDTTQSPATTTDRNGRFVFVDIEAQDYVLVIGNVEVNSYQIVANEGGESAVWTAPLNEIVDTGIHQVLIDGWD